MIFWIFIGIFSLLAVSAVLYPLVAAGKPISDSHAEVQTLYEARIAEIENDLELGRLDVANAAAAKAEVARNLIKAEREDGYSKNQGSRITKSIFVLSALFVPVFAITIYSSIGTPLVASGSPKEASVAGSEPTIETLLAAAERRLAKNPDDVRGWIVIAPVYLRLGRFDDAINVYKNLLRLEGRKADHTFGLGEAIMSKTKGQVTSEARELFVETIGLAPQNAAANFYIGVYSMQQGENAEAISIWQAMVDGAKGDEEWLPTIKQRISELQSQESAPGKSVPEDQIAMINGMVGNLETKLAENPGDQEGWAMLIRSYMVLDRNDDALEAVERARQQFSTDDKFLSQLDKTEAVLEGNLTKENAQ